MRIQSVTVRNYRIHRELTVKLDDFRTLIGGPNECGKSTLVEAIHRALFLKSKVGGDIQKSMVSTLYAAAPEVELSFTAANQEYQLVKRFSGANGATRPKRA
jgi:DNA repair exonuclease SbcCD ATPase subunit